MRLTASHMAGDEHYMGNRPQHELFGAMRGLYHSKEWADLNIVNRDGTRLAGHKAVLCPRSTFVADLVRKEKWHEETPGDISMVDEDPEVVNMMLEYMYLLDYFPPTRSSSSRRTSQDSISDTVTRTGSKGHDSDTMSIRTDAVAFGHAVTAFGGPREDPLITPIPDSPFTLPFRRTLPDATDFSSAMHRSQHPLTRAHSTPAPEISPLATREAHLSFHARAYAAGERYGIAGLKALALDKYKIQLTRHWDHPEFPESIHIVYSSTSASDTDMRGVVADTIDWHSRLFNKPEIEVAVMEINGLAYELLKRSRRTLDRD